MKLLKIAAAQQARGGGGVPAVLTDGNTVAWYDYQESVTKDESDRVSAWGDKSGLSHDLLQATGENQPLYTTDGILFDGVSENLKTAAFTLIQPENIYILFKPITWTSAVRIFDGNGNFSGSFYQTGTTPQVAAYAGIASLRLNASLNNYHIGRILFNGANSILKIDESSTLGADFGSANMGGFTLGARGDGTANFGNVEIKEVIIRKIADSEADETEIYDYLKTKGSL